MNVKPGDIVLEVLGNPCPKGSKSAFIVNRFDPPNARAVIVEGSSDAGRKAYKAWIKEVKDVARAWLVNEGGDEYRQPIDGPVFVRCAFYLPRPPSVKPGKRPWPSVKPDVDKLERAVYDCLTGTVIVDDALIVAGAKSKDYAYDGRPPGVVILVRRMDSR